MYHFKAGAVDNHHQSSSSLLTSLRSSSSKELVLFSLPFLRLPRRPLSTCTQFAGGHIEM